MASCSERYPAGSRISYDRTALIFWTEEGKPFSWTYGRLDRFADGAALALRKKFKKGDRVLLRLQGAEFVAAFYGCVRAGIIPIPASTLLTSAEIQFMKKDSGAKAVLTRFPPKEGRPFPAVPAKPDDPMFWLYTSGTEGRPKAVIHAHRSIPAHDARCREWLDLKPDDVVFNTSALNWSYALTCGLADVLRSGATAVVSTGRPEVERLIGVIAGSGVTILQSVPGLYRRLTEFLEGNPKARRSFRSVRVCLSAGEKLPEEIRRRFGKATGLTIREGLGMTEHSVYLVQPKGRPPVEGSCGRALPGHRVSVLRSDLTPARAGEAGILASHRTCPGLMRGYHRRPKEQRRAFRKGWFLSGDLAFRDAEGNFFFLGRRDDVITASGYRISPMEVESVLNRHPQVAESAVVGREIASGKTVVAAYVVAKRKISETALAGFSGHFLARYKIPRIMVFVKSLPKTANGKLKRRFLGN